MEGAGADKISGVVQQDVLKKSASSDYGLRLIVRTSDLPDHEWRSGRSCNIPVGWVQVEGNRHSESTATLGMHAFNIPVSEAEKTVSA